MEARFNKAPGLTSSTTTARVTPAPVAVPFGEIMGKALTGGAELALNALPGGPLMAMALRSAGGASSSIQQPVSGIGGAASGATGAGSAEGPSVSGAGGAGGAGGAPGGEAANMQSAMAQSQEMNMQYLRLQEQVNTQNRSFTTLSNLMKAEHETVKTAIGNIR